MLVIKILMCILVLNCPCFSNGERWSWMDMVFESLGINYEKLTTKSIEMENFIETTRDDDTKFKPWIDYNIEMKPTTDSSSKFGTESIHELTTDSIYESTTEPTTESIHESRTDSINESSTESINKSTTDSSSKIRTKSIHELTTDSIYESTTEPTTESIHESTNDSINESSTESLNESTTDSSSKIRTESIHELTTDSIYESTTDSIYESIHESTTESINESTTESINESTTESINESTTDSSSKIRTESIHQLTTVSIYESTTEPITESTTESTTESIHESTTDSINESTTESMTEPSTEPTIESTNELTSDSITEVTTELSTQTSSEPATKSQTPASTIKPEKPRLSCPPEKSLHSIKDLKVLIDYVANNLSAVGQIEAAYIDHGVAIRDKHVHDIEEFLKIFEDRPTHLKHVLESCVNIHQKIEHSVKQITTDLEEYFKIEDAYEWNINKLTETENKIKKYSKICELNNCEPVVKRNVPLKKLLKGVPKTSEEYYCSSIKELHDKVHNAVNCFIDSSKIDLKNLTLTEDMNYSKRIDNLKNKLIDTALKDFGRTMYDILLLKDEYYHLEAKMEKVKEDMGVFEIKKNNRQAESMLLDLGRKAEKFRKSCLNCNNKYSAGLRMSRTLLEIQNQKDTYKNIVDQLLEQKQNEIMIKVKENYLTVFDSLNEKLENIESLDKYISILAPVQTEITELTIREKKQLQKLNDVISQLPIDKTLELHAKSKSLIFSIQKSEQDLDNKIKYSFTQT